MTGAEKKRIRDRAWRDLNVTYAQALPAKPELLAPGLRDAARAEVDFRRRRTGGVDRPISPLVGHGVDEIAWARFFDIDWRLAHGISWGESRHGTDPPGKPALFHNAWGLGPWRHFDSWDEGFYYLFGALRRQYIGRGLNTITAIAHKYAPPIENETARWIRTVDGVYRDLGGTRYRR